MISVGFSTTNKILSKIIRKLTKSEASHCWISYFDSTLDRQMVMEAGLEEIRIIPYEQFVKKNQIVGLYEANLEFGLKQMSIWLGTRYDFEGLLGGFLVIIGRWFKRKIKNPLQNPKALFCSEFVATTLQLSKYKGTETLDPATVTPQDLLLLMRATAPQS